MSAERRASLVREPVPVTEGNDLPERVVLWDDDAQRNAARQARRAALRDPDAALALTSQLVQQPVPAAPSLYNPTALYAQLLHAPENLKPHEIDEMDYVRFFGLVREIGLLHEREQDEYERARGDHTLPTGAYPAMTHDETR